MHAAKLLEVAAMLENLPKLVGPLDRFDMNQWFCTKKDVNENPCGTAACAAGWASMLLPHLGILSRPGYSGLSYKLSPAQRAARKPVPVNEVYDFEAVAFACNITCKEAWKLFSTDQENDPVKVAANIRKFVAEKEADCVPG